MFFTIKFAADHIEMLDQRQLPQKEVYLKFYSPDEICWAIKELVIRGAPAIGIAAAMGLALAMEKISPGLDDQQLAQKFSEYKKMLSATRPTAVNLFWALQRMEKAFEQNKTKPAREICARLRQEAEAILAEDIATNHKIGIYGQELLPARGAVLTHCNAGALATGWFGTALGVIRAAREQGKEIEVFADETRPYLQGARLTCWELLKDNIPVTLITDNMAGYLMKKKAICAVIVGADRIALNGDTANKIGTYSLAILADYHRIPFYIAAPVSTIDFSITSGTEIPIEERPAAEVLFYRNEQIGPENCPVWHPAFDITPAKLITAIITEKGIVKNPNQEKIFRLKNIS